MNLKKISFISHMVSLSLVLYMLEPNFPYKTQLTQNSYIILPSISLMFMVLILDFYYNLIGILLFGVLSGWFNVVKYLGIYNIFNYKEQMDELIFVGSQILVKHFLFYFIYLGLLLAKNYREKHRKIVFKKFWLLLFLITLIQNIILTANGIFVYGYLFTKEVSKVTCWPSWLPDLTSLIDKHFILIIWIFNFIPTLISNFLVGILVTFIYKRIQTTNYLYILNKSE
ncbi:hypothetical protein [Candidatus Phytoplasma fraxini]|uniref:Uncharacterized protein n=1 Tax=Ash yellows phytoplasma TaxID=35780 RepID=A0ABZ2U7R0_ASHYP